VRQKVQPLTAVRVSHLSQAGDRNSWNSQPGDLRAFVRQTVDFSPRHMTLDNLAIHDSDMARREFGSSKILGFDGRHILHSIHSGIEPGTLDVLYRAATAASGRRPVYGDANSLGITWAQGI